MAERCGHRDQAKLGAVHLYGLFDELLQCLQPWESGFLPDILEKP
jgi:hypothetical protein